MRKKSHTNAQFEILIPITRVIGRITLNQYIREGIQIRCNHQGMRKRYLSKETFWSICNFVVFYVKFLVWPTRDRNLNAGLLQ